MWKVESRNYHFRTQADVESYRAPNPRHVFGYLREDPILASSTTKSGYANKGPPQCRTRDRDGMPSLSRVVQYSEYCVVLYNTVPV